MPAYFFIPLRHYFITSGALFVVAFLKVCPITRNRPETKSNIPALPYPTQFCDVSHNSCKSLQLDLLDKIFTMESSDPQAAFDSLVRNYPCLNFGQSKTYPTVS
ncbi:unnamed protein product, partial [Calicophoron daubneyi]